MTAATNRSELSLIRQFTLMASILVGAGTIMLGSFVTDEIQRDLVHIAAAGTSNFVSKLNELFLDELSSGSKLSPESLEMLDTSLANSEAGREIVSVRIWRPDGSIAYATRRNPVKTDFSTNSSLQKALHGQMSAHIETAASEPGAAARDSGAPLLDTYTPIHGKSTDRVVAVAELFTRADELEASIETTRLRSWFAIGGVALLQITSFYAIARRGNKTIKAQRAVHRASLEANERFLRRISADLHDGPAQLVSLALLKLGGLRPLLAPQHSKTEEIDKIKVALQDSLEEIRHTAAGLAPPHLERMSLRKVLEKVIRQHEQRTGSDVEADIGALPMDVSSIHKVSIYRFVQQGLNNAFHHAAGAGQRVHAASDGASLVVEITDNGPGFAPSKTIASDRLGLAGMRDRIESLGGTFTLETNIGAGTLVRASFQVDDIVTLAEPAEWV